MAEQVKLVVRDVDGADISSINLMAGGYLLDGDSWQQGVASEGDESVDEVIPMHITGSSHDDLAAKVQALDDLLQQVERYRDAVERYSVWLRVKMTNETAAREALILKAKRSPGVAVRSIFGLNENTIKAYQLGLERMPWWESSGTAVAYASTGGINLLGGAYQFVDGSSTKVPGERPSRLNSVEFEGATTTGPVTELWLGFRSDRLGGSASSFNPVLDVPQGTVGADTTVVNDATAKTGHKASCDFATNANLVTRLTTDWADMGLTLGYYRGRHLVLLRAKCGDASTVARVRFGVGTKGGDFAVWNLVTVQGADWNLYPLGYLEAPAFTRWLAGDNDVAVRFEASRSAGTSTLELDCVILIPISEGFVHVAGAAIQGSLTAIVYDQPEGIVSGHATISGGKKSVTCELLGGLPQSSGGGGAVYAILAGKRVNSTVLTEKVDLNLVTYPRWTTLRGAG